MDDEDGDCVPEADELIEISESVAAPSLVESEEDRRRRLRLRQSHFPNKLVRPFVRPRPSVRRAWEQGSKIDIRPLCGVLRCSGVIKEG